jgi:hypothetical protein
MSSDATFLDLGLAFVGGAAAGAAVMGLGALFFGDTKRASFAATTSAPVPMTWQEYQTAACGYLGLPELGGPGKPDCVGGIEVKFWKEPVHAGTVRRERVKGRTALVAQRFRPTAYEQAEVFDMPLVEFPG